MPSRCNLTFYFLDNIGPKTCLSQNNKRVLKLFMMGKT